jgi:hypothetical protein
MNRYECRLNQTSSLSAHPCNTVICVCLGEVCKCVYVPQRVRRLSMVVYRICSRRIAGRSAADCAAVVPSVFVHNSSRGRIAHCQRIVQSATNSPHSRDRTVRRNILATNTCCTHTQTLSYRQTDASSRLGCWQRTADNGASVCSVPCGDCVQHVAGYSGAGAAFVRVAHGRLVTPQPLPSMIKIFHYRWSLSCALPSASAICCSVCHRAPFQSAGAVAPQHCN